MSNVMKIRPGGAELFHADGRIDTMKPIVAIGNCAKASHKFRGTHVLKLAPDCSFLSNVTQLMDG
jgi:hypothetical protein